jgi:hypothetical protein
VVGLRMGGWLCIALCRSPVAMQPTIAPLSGRMHGYGLPTTDWPPSK